MRLLYTRLMVRPWRTIASRTVHADRWINVRADDCITETGQEIAPYYVLSYPDWVNVAALTAQDELVLVEQYRHGVAAAVLELPGGAVDPGDVDLIAAAQRELLEETGYTAERFCYVTGLFANPATQTNQVHTVLATGCRRVSAPQLDDTEEGMQVRTVPAADVLAGLRSGIIGQSMQVAGLLLALEKAGRISF